MDIIKRVVADIFDSKILKYAFLPFLISMIFWGIVFIVFSGNIIDFIHIYISKLPFGDSINHILTGIGSTIILIFLYYELVIMSIGIFSSFFVEKITLRINEKYYNASLQNTSIIEGVFVSIKGMILFIVVFIFTFYLLFIPIINIFYQLFLWSIAVKKPLIYDSASLFCNYKEIEKRENIKIWIIVFLTSFIYFIPILSFFGYTMQLILLTHFVLNKCKR